MNASHDLESGDDPTAVMDDYDERAVQTARELEELVQLRTELSWSAWKSHPRFKKARLIRDAQRRFSVGAPANDVGQATDNDGAQGGDECFAAVCDAQRDGWIDAIESETTGEPERAGGLDHE